MTSAVGPRDSGPRALAGEDESHSRGSGKTDRKTDRRGTPVISRQQRTNGRGGRFPAPRPCACANRPYLLLLHRLEDFDNAGLVIDNIHALKYLAIFPSAYLPHHLVAFLVPVVDEGNGSSGGWAVSAPSTSHPAAPREVQTARCEKRKQIKRTDAALCTSSCVRCRHIAGPSVDERAQEQRRDSSEEASAKRKSRRR